MTVTIAGTWQAANCASTLPGILAQAAAQPVTANVTTTAGDWLIAIVTWTQQFPGQGVSCCIADDARNWWEPLGAPSADTSAAGSTRVAIWAAPAARAAKYVQAAPTGPYLACSLVVLDLAGMAAGMTLSAITQASAQAATTLTAAAAAVSSPSLAIAAAGWDAGEASTVPGGSWTTLYNTYAVGSGTSAPAIGIGVAWQQVTSSIPAATWTLAAAADMAAETAGVLISAALPAQASPGWPVVITEAAIGSGPQAPPSEMTWVPLSSRSLSLSITQGRQYTLGQLQAGQGTLTLDDPDGALIPPGTGAYAGIDSGTPVRRRICLPATATPWYIAFSGYLKRWPWAMDSDMYRGQTSCELTDTWGYAAGTLSSMLREEYALDQPYAYWPLSDPAGSTDGSNIAQGNSSPLQLVTSKNGTGGSAVTWSASLPAAVAPSGLLGDSSATITTSGQSGGATGLWQQQLTGTSLDTNGYGQCLLCFDSGYPPISGGVTIDAWICGTSNTNTTGYGFSNSGNTITVPGSSFADGTPVAFTVDPGYSLPAGMTAGQVYYVIAQSGATFQISATVGGSAVSLTTNGAGYMATTVPWNMVAWSARNLRGRIVELAVRASDGALLLNYVTVSGTVTAAVIDTGHDYRFTALAHVSVAFNQAAYRVVVNGGLWATVSGSFSSAVAASFDELAAGGVFDLRTATGSAWCGYLGHLAIWPYMLPVVRQNAHYDAGLTGLAGDLAHGRVERALEYAGIAGRRLIMPLTMDHSLDPCASGQDVGGQSAATMATNIQQSTLPSLLYVAPTGDVTYLAKQYAWNNSVKWVLGDGAGEIPCLPGGLATDYDPARLANDVQLTQLDTQSVTIPAGTMSGTTVRAVEAASRAQYGDIPYQQTAYLEWDYSAPYSAGSGLQDLADWIAMVYASPRNRVQSVTVQAAASSAGVSGPARWQLWAGASVGDMVTVNARPPTASTSPLISVTGRITQTQRRSKWSLDGCDASIALVIDFAPEYNVLTCDDAVRGLLNGQNVLAWLRHGIRKGRP